MITVNTVCVTCIKQEWQAKLKLIYTCIDPPWQYIPDLLYLPWIFWLTIAVCSITMTSKPSWLFWKGTAVDNILLSFFFTAFLHNNLNNCCSQTITLCIYLIYNLVSLTLFFYQITSFNQEQIWQDNELLIQMCDTGSSNIWASHCEKGCPYRRIAMAQASLHIFLRSLDRAIAVYTHIIKGTTGRQRSDSTALK